jgi:hypothetical protein
VSNQRGGQLNDFQQLKLHSLSYIASIAQSNLIPGISELAETWAHCRNWRNGGDRGDCCYWLRVASGEIGEMAESGEIGETADIGEMADISKTADIREVAEIQERVQIGETTEIREMAEIRQTAEIGRWAEPRE